MPQHNALILDKRGGVLRVVTVAAAVLGDKQIAVRTRAVAINPVDRYMPPLGRFITPWLTYPAILGSDIAGIVVAVGAKVTRFRVGDRVLGLALGTDKGRGPAEGAFQDQVVLDAALTSPIPDDMAFEDAAVLPLGLSTAAGGLFQRDYLALRHFNASAPPDGRSVLIWGGSSSVGSNAIQLASQAGYDVVTTASPHNHAYVTGLGARRAFDYRSPTVVADLLAALRGREMAGAMAIGDGAVSACIDVLSQSRGRRLVAVATPGISFEALVAGSTSWHRLLPFLARMGLVSAQDAWAARRAGVETKFIWGSSLKDNEIGPMIFSQFLPHALAKSRYAAVPPAIVVGNGLPAIPAAFAAHAAGVSARKVVVTLGTTT